MTTNKQHKNTTPRSLRQSKEYACYMEKKGWKVISVQLSANSVQPEKDPGQERTSTGETRPAPPRETRPDLSGRVEELAGAGNAGIENPNVTNAFVKKIPLLGSVVKIQRPPAIPSEKVLDKLAKKHNALFIKIEPGISIQPSAISFQPDTWPLLPTKTLHLNLTKSEEELWENLDSDARYSVRKAGKQLSADSVQLSALGGDEENELRKFHQILNNTGKRHGFPTPGWQDLKNLVECFGGKARLVSTSIEESLPNSSTRPDKSGRVSLGQGKNPKHIAGCILLTHAGTAYYHHAATTKKGRDLLAGYLVLWKAIKQAKKLNCHTFDFEGIYDERYHKRTKAWKGFSYFKKKFGGKEVAYPQPIIKYYSLPIKLMAKLFG